MKKLVIVAGLACAAMFASGATVDWKVERNSNDFTKNGTVYAFLAADSATVTTALGGLTSPFSASSFETALGSTLYSKATGNGRGAADGQLMGTDSQIADNSDISMMLVVFSEDGKNYTTVSGVTGHSYSATTVGTKSDANFSSSFTSASWTPVGGGGGGGTDVPEPTSGLLLVLGGAMLALRRRRA